VAPPFSINSTSISLFRVTGYWSSRSSLMAELRVFFTISSIPSVTFLVDPERLGLA